MSHEANLLPYYLISFGRTETPCESEFVKEYASQMARATTSDLIGYIHEFYDGTQKRTFIPHLIVSAAINQGDFIMAQKLVPSLRIIMNNDLECGKLDPYIYYELKHLLDLEEKYLKPKIM